MTHSTKIDTSSVLTVHGSEGSPANPGFLLHNALQLVSAVAVRCSRGSLTPEPPCYVLYFLQSLAEKTPHSQD